MTCREELLKATHYIITEKGKNEFTVGEVIEYLKNHNSKYEANTIRTHLTSKCCATAKPNHGTVYDDYEKLGWNLYKIKKL